MGKIKSRIKASGQNPDMLCNIEGVSSFESALERRTVEELNI